MEQTVVLRKEIYSRRAEGYCFCACTTKIIKFENSSLSRFTHGHRYTTENDPLFRSNIFRCPDCKQLIDDTFCEISLDNEVSPGTIKLLKDDPRLINGHLPNLDCRLISEECYQKLTAPLTKDNVNFVAFRDVHEILNSNS